MDVLKKLRANVAAHLDLCNALDTPFICGQLDSAESRAKLEESIVDKVLTERIGIGAAIIEIESELNPNSYVE